MYVQSDPIGLGDGPNTFGYAGSNPVGNIDPNGLAIQFPALIGLVLSNGGRTAASNAARRATQQAATAAANAATAPMEAPDPTDDARDEAGDDEEGEATGEGEEQCRPGDDNENEGFDTDNPDTSNPFTGEPGDVSQSNNSRGQRNQERLYGNDGFPEMDIDYDHDHGSGSPHGHDWGRPSDGSPPTWQDRGPGYPININLQ